jgi:hypothetical protein
VGASAVAGGAPHAAKASARKMIKMRFIVTLLFILKILCQFNPRINLYCPSKNAKRTNYLSYSSVLAYLKHQGHYVRKGKENGFVLQLFTFVPFVALVSGPFYRQKPERPFRYAPN